MDLIDALNLKISSLFLAESGMKGEKPPLLGHYWPTHAENETKTLSGAVVYRSLAKACPKQLAAACGGQQQPRRRLQQGGGAGMTRNRDQQVHASDHKPEPSSPYLSSGSATGCWSLSFPFNRRLRMSAESSPSSAATSTLSPENFSVIFVGIVVLILVFVGTTSGRDSQRYVC